MSPNMLWCAIYILDGLRVSTFSTHLYLVVNYSFNYYWKCESKWIICLLETLQFDSNDCVTPDYSFIWCDGLNINPDHYWELLDS